MTSVKIVKWLVIGMVVILTVRVMPYIGESVAGCA